MAERERGREGDRGKISYFKQIKFGDLDQHVCQARSNEGEDGENKKFVFIADMSGKA